MLSDAEEKQVTESAVKLWLEDLRDLAYDMDDLLDAIATEALRRKLMADGSETTTSSTAVRAPIPACFPISLNPTALMFSVRMGSKIEKITNRVQEIANQIGGLRLLRNAGGSSNARETVLPTTSLVDAPRVYGRGDDKRAILNRLRNDEASENEICVIPILGMPGVGKTALAQLAFNDGEVKKHFDPRVWISVTYDFDVMRVTKTILQSIASSFRDVDDLNLLPSITQRELGREEISAGVR